MHWLSQKSADAPDHVSPTLSGIPPCARPLQGSRRSTGSAFWKRDRPNCEHGGKLLCLVIIETGEPTNSDLLWKHLWDAVVDAGEGRPADGAEQLRITIPIWYRSLAELKAPFGPKAGLPDCASSISRQPYAPDPFWAALEKTGHSAQFGSPGRTPCGQFSAPTILAAIGADRGNLLDDLCARYAERIAAAPMRYDWNLAAVVIKTN